MNAVQARLFVMVSAVLAVAGCATPGTKAPAPIESRAGAAATDASGVRDGPAGPVAPNAAAEDEPATLAYALPAAPQSPTPSRTPAVQSLFASALQSATRGEWDRAQAALERAIRLAPEDAGLWTELAYTQYRRGALDQAGQTAERALSIARAQAADVASLRRLISAIESGRRAADEERSPR